MTPNSNKPNLEPKVQAFVDAVAQANKNAKPLYELSYEDARKVLLGAQSQEKHNDIKCDIEDMEFPVGPTGKVDMRLLLPKGNREKLPVIFYIHGGGWVMGDKVTHDRLVRQLCVGVNAAVFYVNYTPSPDAQFPIITEQAYAAMEYIVKNANKFNVDASRLAVAGDSVGGNMSAVMTLMSKRKNGPKIKFQALLYPVTDASMSTESYSQFAEGPWLTKKAMEYFWDAYAPDKEKRKDIYMSPLNASKEELAGLPAALVITDENDVLRDEGEMYAKKLMDAGVDVVSTRYNGTHHDFMMLDGIKNAYSTIGAIDQAVCMLKKHLYA